MKIDIEDALAEAAKLIAKEGGTPKDMYHPDYGWILLNGEPTEAAHRFYTEKILTSKPRETDPMIVES